MNRVLSADQRAAALAATQFGAISLRQARAVGLSEKQVFDRFRVGRWMRRARGVYVVAGSPDTPMQRTMVAYLAVSEAGGVVSHMSAAAVWGLCAFPAVPHVTVPSTASTDARGATVHRGSISARDRMQRQRIGVTSVSRTLADLATCQRRPALEEIVDQAFCRRLATAETALRAAAAAGDRRRGIALLRSVVEIWTSEIKPGSVAEIRLLRQLAELGFEALVTQHEVLDGDGAFVARLDVADPAIRCGLEYDGVLRHSPRAWPRDEGRYEQILAAGWRVDSVSKFDLLPGERRLPDIAARWASKRSSILVAVTDL